MNTLHLSLRLTHGYVGAYAHLDEWRDLPAGSNPVRLTPMKPVDGGNGLDDRGAYTRWMVLPRGMSRRERDEAVAAAQDTLSRHGCAHSYDCCGCASYDTRAVRRHGRRVLLRTTVTRNY